MRMICEKEDKLISWNVSIIRFGFSLLDRLEDWILVSKIKVYFSEFCDDVTCDLFIDDTGYTVQSDRLIDN